MTISTKEIIARVKTALVQQGVGIAARIPDVDAQITLFQSPELVRATNVIRTLDQTAPILAWLTVISAVGAVAVAPRGRRRSTTSGVGLAVAVAMALLALGLVIGRSILLNSIPPDAVSPAAAQSLVETLLVPLRTSVRLVFVVGPPDRLGGILGRPLTSRGVCPARSGECGRLHHGQGRRRPGQAVATLVGPLPADPGSHRRRNRCAGADLLAGPDGGRRHLDGGPGGAGRSPGRTAVPPCRSARGRGRVRPGGRRRDRHRAGHPTGPRAHPGSATVSATGPTPSGGPPDEPNPTIPLP